MALPALIACNKVHPDKKRPVAVKGSIDLRGWDLKNDGPLKLDGEWEFCWNQTGSPPDIIKAANRKKCSCIAVPSLWTDRVINGSVLPGKGRAAYRLIIINGPDNNEKSLCIHRIFSAYRLWINGALADERGKVAGSTQSKEDYIFIHNKRYTTFVPNEGPNEILLEVFNSEHESGGIDRSILLEDRQIVEENKFRQHTVSMIVFGMLLFASIYNIVLYFFRRQEMAALYFGFFCLTMAINTINHHYPILSGAFSYPENPYIINYITVIVTINLCLLTIRSLFPDECSRYSIRVSQFAAVIFMVPLFLVRFTTAEPLMRIFFVSMIFFIMYSFYVLVKAILNRRNDALLFLIGFTPMFAGGINDVLYALWIINTANIAQYGLIVLCITTTMVISRRFARAMRTVEKLSEDLAEKNRSLEMMDRLKNQFLANTSHELRTPLHGMIGLSESMLEGAAGSLPPKAQKNLSLISSSGHRLASMVNDLLDMAKIQDEGLTLNRGPVDLYTLSETVVRLSVPLLGEKPVRIINRIKPDTPRVYADEERIRQVLHNLVGNAIKFTNSGKIEISARHICREEEIMDPDIAGMVEVSVSDTGIGIPPEFRDKIFEAYLQVDGTDTRQHGGTGLGLAIAKQIVEMHNGVISVASGKKGGSVFSFTLPGSNEAAPETMDAVIIEGMDDQADSARTAEETSSGYLQRDPVMLVVDDDPVNTSIIHDYFTSKGWVVKTAPEGPLALEIIDSDETIDLVLLDIMMPVMSGYEACRRIRAKRQANDLPVIMLTANNMMSDIDLAFEAGANDYIVKPFRLNELFSRVNKMLRLKKIRKSAAEGLTIRGKSRTYSLKFSEIIYITSHSKSCVIHTEDRDIELPLLMKDIIHRLPPDIFVRIHKSHMININYVESVSHVVSGRYRVRLSNNDEIELPVGPAYLDSLRKRI